MSCAMVLLKVGAVMGWLDDCPARFVGEFFIYLFFWPHVDVPLTAKKRENINVNIYRHHALKVFTVYINNDNWSYFWQHIFQWLITRPDTFLLCMQARWHYLLRVAITHLGSTHTGVFNNFSQLENN